MADPLPTALFNTALDLRTFYENSVLGGEYPDPNETYVLFSMVKNLIEDMYEIQISLSLDTSQVANVGDTYLSMKTLPLDYGETKKIVLTNASGGISALSYSEIPFRNREKYQTSARKFYIDQKNKQFALCGTVNTQSIINHYYRCYTSDMTVGTENNANPIAWPNRFWPLIAFGAAAYRQGGFDADAMQFRMSIENQATFNNLLDGFIAWDHKLKLGDMNGRGGYADDVVQEDDETLYNYVGFL